MGKGDIMKSCLQRLAISVCALFSLVSCRFTAPTVEEAKTTLGEAGYAVTVKTSEELTDETEPFLSTITGIENCLHAKKEKDEIYLIYFFSIDWAEDEYSFINTDFERKGQINHLIYVGTKQAVKDAKL